MSIGSHKVGQMFTAMRTGVASGFSSLYGKKSQTLPQAEPYNINGITSAQVPPTPSNPYRKKPVKLVYDSNEYHMFRLPSEKAFLLGSYDYEDVFGQRKGINHSPHLRAQMDMDSNLVWFIAGVSLIGLIIENKRTHDFVTLRENMVNSDKGWFSEEDFI